MGEGLTSRRHKGIELDSLRDLRLMRQKLDLLEPHDVRELQNDLLGVFAELGTLPPPGLWRIIQELGHRVV